MNIYANTCNRNYSIHVILIPIIILLSVMNLHSKEVLNTRINPISLTLDGEAIDGGWALDFDNRIDPLETTAREIIFASEVDTLKLILDVWERQDVTIRTEEGNESTVRATRISGNVFEHPDPKLLLRSESGLLSKEQAQFDINAMVYGLSQVHPDMFSVCRQDDFFKAINQSLQTLPDSISTVDLYMKISPVVSMIGDGHTSLKFPFNDLFTNELRRLPLAAKVNSDKSVICNASIDSIIPAGARILSINGIGSEKIIDSMLPYASGEKEFTKVGMIDHLFSALYEVMYPAESYTIEYITKHGDHTMSTVLPALTYDEIVGRMPSRRRSDKSEPYSYTVDKIHDVAILDFKSCVNPSKMKAFAESLFSELRSEEINNLIIDVRENGGGNSEVGDILLQYISPIPFEQMEKSLVRITPLTRKLMGNDFAPLMFALYDTAEDEYSLPRSVDANHYNGNVYILTSNRTFSSGSSFAWTFKECGAGIVIGEETGGMNVSFGDIVYYRLPVSGIYCSISYKRFWQFKADEDDIHGTLPDIEVPAGEAMDRALEIIQQSR